MGKVPGGNKSKQIQQFVAFYVHVKIGNVANARIRIKGHKSLMAPNLELKQPIGASVKKTITFWPQ